MGIKNTLDEIVNISKEIEQLENEKDKINDEIRELKRNITAGYGDSRDPVIICQLNQAIRESKLFEEAACDDLIIHKGYKITLSMSEEGVEKVVTVQKIWTLEDVQHG